MSRYKSSYWSKGNWVSVEYMNICGNKLYNSSEDPNSFRPSASVAKKNV